LPASSSSTTLSEWRPSLGAGSPLRTERTKATLVGRTVDDIDAPVDELVRRA